MFWDFDETNNDLIKRNEERNVEKFYFRPDGWALLAVQNRTSQQSKVVETKWWETSTWEWCFPHVETIIRCTALETINRKLNEQFLAAKKKNDFFFRLRQSTVSCSQVHTAICAQNCTQTISFDRFRFNRHWLLRQSQNRRKKNLFRLNCFEQFRFSAFECSFCKRNECVFDLSVSFVVCPKQNKMNCTTLNY